MKTVTEVSRLTGVSVRTLHHYDSIGLLPPSSITEAGYRLYDETAIERLYLIILYRELDFSLKQIGTILDAPDFDRNQALSHQIRLLEEKRQKLQNRIHLARALQLTGVKFMDYTDFDYRKIDEYQHQAKTLYGNSEPYREYEKKVSGRSHEAGKALGEELMGLFAGVGSLRHLDPGDAAVQEWVAQLQRFITTHYYTCTASILQSLGRMYAGGGSMTENIDNAGGAGTGAFARDAIEIFCKTQSQ